MNSSPLDIWQHLKIAFSSPAVLLFISWEWAIPITVPALFLACAALAHLYEYLKKRGIVQRGKKFFSRERELSFRFLPPQLEELRSSAHDAFWNVGGRAGISDSFDRFMCAINLIDAENQLRGTSVDPPTLPDTKGGQAERVLSFAPLKSTLGIEDETAYLCGLKNCRASIVTLKILYEYQRANGSLTYWLFDKKPLLTMAELMRRLPDEERGAFAKYCQKMIAAVEAEHREMMEGAKVSNA